MTPTKTLHGQDLPMDELDLRKLAWKAFEKQIAGDGDSFLQPSSDAPNFVKYRGTVAAIFYNNHQYFAGFVYDVAREKFHYSPELTEMLSQEELV